MTAAKQPDRAPAVKVLSGRKRKQSEGDITTHLQRIRAIAQDPAVYLQSLAVPQRGPRTPGRPGHYPHWAYTVFNALIGPDGAARQVAADLEDPDTWQMFVDGARLHLGDGAVAGVPTVGPRRHHWNTWSSTYGVMYVAPLGDAFRDLALAQAVAQGLLDPETPGTLARPDRTNMVVGDGKVMSSPCRNRTRQILDKTTGEVIATRRCDDASGDWYESGDKDKKVYGSKFVTLSARDDSYYGRVVLDIEHLPPVAGIGGEAALAEQMLTRLKQAAGDGMKGFAWDGALSGVHINRLMRLGLLAVSPTKALVAGDDDTPRMEKAKRIAPFTADGPNGKCKHDLWGIGGQAHERTLLDDGTEHFDPLPFRLKREGRPGAYRWYHLVTIACHRNGDHRDVVVPLHITGDDEDKGFNRPEYLRQAPPGTEDYGVLYGYRPDSESFNMQAESRFYFHRLPAYGAARQLLVMLGLALSENAVSRYHHRRRAASAAAIAAA